MDSYPFFFQFWSFRARLCTRFSTKKAWKAENLFHVVLKSMFGAAAFMQGNVEGFPRKWFLQLYINMPLVI